MRLEASLPQRDPSLSQYTLCIGASSPLTSPLPASRPTLAFPGVPQSSPCIEQLLPRHRSRPSSVRSFFSRNRLAGYFCPGRSSPLRTSLPTRLFHWDQPLSQNDSNRTISPSFIFFKNGFLCSTTREIGCRTFINAIFLTSICFARSPVRPQLRLPTWAVYFQSCVVQPLQLYCTFPLHPFACPRSHSRRFSTARHRNRTTSVVLWGSLCLDSRELWILSTMQTCCYTPSRIGYNRMDIIGQLTSLFESFITADWPVE